MIKIKLSGDVFYEKQKTVIIAIVIILAMAVIVGAIFIINKKAPKPEDALSTYISLLNEQKYEEMYNMISEYSKSQISQDDFVKKEIKTYMKELMHMT